MKKAIFGICAILVIVLGFYLVTGDPIFKNDFRKITLPNGEILIAEIADSETKRNLGLSGRESLDKNSGMLFVFDKIDKHYFWMKDMNFPIDILWLNDKLEIAYILEAISPETYPQSFTSPTPAKLVLEINAGIADEHSLMVGDKLILNY